MLPYERKSAEQEKGQKRAFRDEQRRREDDIKVVVSTVEGRRFLFALCSDGHIFTALDPDERVGQYQKGMHALATMAWRLGWSGSPERMNDMMLENKKKLRLSKGEEDGGPESGSIDG